MAGIRTYFGSNYRMDPFPKSVTIYGIRYDMVSHKDYCMQADTLPAKIITNRSLMLAERGADGSIEYRIESPIHRMRGPTERDWRIEREWRSGDPMMWEGRIQPYNEDEVKIYVSSPVFEEAARAAMEALGAAARASAAALGAAPRASAAAAAPDVRGVLGGARQASNQKLNVPASTSETRSRKYRTARRRNTRRRTH